MVETFGLESTAGSGKGKSQFPLSAALAFSLQGIMLRIGRIFLVFAGISLAMAFTNALLVTDVLYRNMADSATIAAGTQAGAFRWMWVGVALLISTAGTFNAVLMSVTERVKEIGTLKCLGARNIHIVEIFLFESSLLGLLGGLAGGVLGWVFAVVNFSMTVGAKYITAEALLAGAKMILVCGGLSMVLSLLASVVPVLIAAKIEPASAMRYEV